MSRDNSGLVKIGKKSRPSDRGGRPEDCPPRAWKRKNLSSVLPVLKALSDENRLAIVELLLGAEDELCACDIEDAFDVAQSTISHHMKVLRDAGLVDAEKRGLWVYYRPTAAARTALEALLASAKR